MLILLLLVDFSLTYIHEWLTTPPVDSRLDESSMIASTDVLNTATEVSISQIDSQSASQLVSCSSSLISETSSLLRKNGSPSSSNI